MSETQSTDELLRRRGELCNAAQGLALESLDIPDDMKKELGALDEPARALADRAGVLLAQAGERAFARHDMPAAVNLLARASTPEQAKFIGNQSGGRVFLFLSTDDFWRDYHRMTDAGVRFVRPPSVAPYGTVAVFEDLYGNRWDLVQYGAPSNIAVNSANKN